MAGATTIGAVLALLAVATATPAFAGRDAEKAAADAALTAAVDHLRPLLDHSQRQMLDLAQARWSALRRDFGSFPGYSEEERDNRFLRMTADRLAMITAEPDAQGPGAPVFHPVFDVHVDPALGLEIELIWPEVAAPGFADLNGILAAKAHSSWMPPQVDEAPIYPHTHIASFRIAYASADFVSIELGQYERADGDAEESRFAVNYLPRAGRRLGFDDVLDAPRSKRLAAHCRDVIAAAFRARGVTDDIAVPLWTEFVPGPITTLGAWVFDQAGAHILYGRGYLAQVPAGDFQCDLSWAELRDYLRPDAPLPFDR